MSWKIKREYILWHRLFDLPVIALWYCCCYVAFFPWFLFHFSLQWRHNERYGVSNHRCLEGLLDLLFRRRSKKTSKLRVTGRCEGNSPVNSPHKGHVTWKMFSFDDVIVYFYYKSHNEHASYPKIHTTQKRNVHISVIYGVWWDMGQAHCELCKICLLMWLSIYVFISTAWSSHGKVIVFALQQF